MSKAMMIRVAHSLFVSLLLSGPTWSLAQHPEPKANARIPWACRFLTADYEVEKDDPQEERNYAASEDRFYSLRCTSVSSSVRTRSAAAGEMTECWKKLWYRDEPFNAAFHEIGSSELLVIIAIAHEIPKPLTADPTFMRDWLEDCKASCFQMFGEDDPGARARWQELVQLRKYAIKQLRSAKPVVEMLKNAKLDPVN